MIAGIELACAICVTVLTFTFCRAALADSPFSPGTQLVTSICIALLSGIWISRLLVPSAAPASEPVARPAAETSDAAWLDFVTLPYGALAIAILAIIVLWLAHRFAVRCGWLKWARFRLWNYGEARSPASCTAFTEIDLREKPSSEGADMRIQPKLPTWLHINDRLREAARFPLGVLAFSVSTMVAWLGIWWCWRVAQWVFHNYLSESWI